MKRFKGATEIIDKAKGIIHGDENLIYVIISCVIVFIIVFSFITYISIVLSKKDNMCDKLDKIYLGEDEHFSTTSFYSDTYGNIKPTGKYENKNNQNNFFNNNNKCLVKNYYIKTAYNCCCGSEYKNSFVNECALNTCIREGARCLDFEIYSYNGEPIVAASTANNNTIKETFNYLKLYRVFEILRDDAFNSSVTSCAYDPMFLHFRIMSETSSMYDKIAQYIEDVLDEYDNVADVNTFNYKYTNQDNLLEKPISSIDLRGKFIIMVNTLHSTILENSDLVNYTHVRSGSNTMQLMRYDELIASGENNALTIDKSKRSLIMVLPSINNDIFNFDPYLAFGNGCQFIGMKFQNMDNYLKSYFNAFKDRGNFSFIIKPSNLRKDLIEEEVDLIEEEAESDLVTTTTTGFQRRRDNRQNRRDNLFN